jgi:3-methyl-2-oxobutanoate hydroxymethyltransferase
MGHVGLMPQSVNGLGGFRAQGKSQAEADQILADAIAIANAGAFSIVVEGTYEAVARHITEQVEVPTIGIGASPACDGQVLVTEDLLGLTGGQAPKFVKRFAELDRIIGGAAKSYAEEVRARTFPSAEQCYGSKKSK